MNDDLNDYIRKLQLSLVQAATALDELIKKLDTLDIEEYTFQEAVDKFIPGHKLEEVKFNPWGCTCVNATGHFGPDHEDDCGNYTPYSW